MEIISDDSFEFEELPSEQKSEQITRKDYRLKLKDQLDFSVIIDGNNYPLIDASVSGVCIAIESDSPLEEDDEIYLAISEKVKPRQLGIQVHDDLMNRQKPPASIEYQGRKYFMEKEAPGFYNEVAKGDEWVEFISWDFEDEQGEYVITIEQWDEREFEASAGKRIKEFEISNILPK